MEVYDQPGQKVLKTLSQPMAGHDGMHLSQLCGEAQIRRSPSVPYLKNNEEPGTGGSHL
jgi:hypothetical protein